MCDRARVAALAFRRSVRAFRARIGSNALQATLFGSSVSASPRSCEAVRRSRQNTTGATPSGLLEKFPRLDPLEDRPEEARSPIANDAPEPRSSTDVDVAPGS